jgi:hypothetical protein
MTDTNKGTVTVEVPSHAFTPWSASLTPDKKLLTISIPVDIHEGKSGKTMIVASSRGYASLPLAIDIGKGLQSITFSGTAFVKKL